MTKRSIFTNSIIATCLLLGTVGCAGSDSNSETSEDTTSVEDETLEDVVATDEPVEISVIIGQTSGSAVAYQATLGSKVQFKLLNPDADDEFHLHGYDLTTTATAGQEAMIEFTADQLGSFDLESHVTGDWILTLVVEE
ncbi:MAG: hypothetical protein O2847_04780 [Actinomycetota bacterium]|jgi:hypothetical protein|nr:hypothetical protein [Actinomycetota bacterium]MDA3042388.1 hypothetical protein [Actinomycetota bacterium]